GINISNLTAIGCTSGFFVSNFNQPMSGDDIWWRFDIQLANLSARECKDDSLVIGDAAGVAIRGVKAQDRSIRLKNARDCTLSETKLTGPPLIVQDQDDADAPKSNVSIRHADIDNGYVDLSNCRGLTCTDVRVTHPVGQGVRMSNVQASDVKGISAE